MRRLPRHEGRALAILVGLVLVASRGIAQDLGREVTFQVAAGEPVEQVLQRLSETVGAPLFGWVPPATTLADEAWTATGPTHEVLDAASARLGCAWVWWHDRVVLVRLAARDEQVARCTAVARYWTGWPREARAALLAGRVVPVEQLPGVLDLARLPPAGVGQDRLAVSLTYSLDVFLYNCAAQVPGEVQRTGCRRVIDRAELTCGMVDNAFGPLLAAPLASAAPPKVPEAPVPELAVYDQLGGGDGPIELPNAQCLDLRDLLDTLHEPGGLTFEADRRLETGTIASIGFDAPVPAGDVVEMLTVALQCELRDLDPILLLVPIEPIERGGLATVEAIDDLWYLTHYLGGFIRAEQLDRAQIPFGVPDVVALRGATYDELPPDQRSWIEATIQGEHSRPIPHSTLFRELLLRQPQAIRIRLVPRFELCTVALRSIDFNGRRIQAANSEQLTRLDALPWDELPPVDQPLYVPDREQARQDAEQLLNATASSGRVVERLALARTLRQIRLRRYLPLVQGLLADPDLETRLVAASALREMGEDPATNWDPELISRTADQPALRPLALAARAETDDLAQLRALLGHPQATVRQAAALELGRLRDRSAEQQLASVSEQDPELAVRVASEGALLATRHSRWPPEWSHIQAYLVNGDRDVRIALAEALSLPNAEVRLGALKCGWLMRLAEVEDSAVQTAAYAGLGQYPFASYAERLEQRLPNLDGPAAIAAAGSLLSILSLTADHSPWWGDTRSPAMDQALLMAGPCRWERGDTFVCLEHILLGLLDQDSPNNARRLLLDRGIDLAWLRQQIDERLTYWETVGFVRDHRERLAAIRPEFWTDRYDGVYDHWASQILASAGENARQEGLRQFTSGHFLQAWLEVECNTWHQGVLFDAGLRPGDVTEDYLDGSAEGAL